MRRRVGHAEAARDLVSETFLLALRKIAGYRQRGAPFRAWLYRLASTCVNRWVRREARAPRRAPLVEEPHAPERGGADATAELVRRALLALPPRYQTALALHYLEGLSVEEVAAAQGCRPGTVKARLARGRERLRRRLAPHAEEILS